MMQGSLASGNVFGDFLALCMTFCMAAMIVSIRSGAAVDMLPAAFASAVLSMLLTAPFANISSVSNLDIIYIAIFGVVQLGLGLLFLTEGSRRIPSAKAALIGSLDIPLAIAWVWLAFSEVPTSMTIVGGIIVLLAVAYDMRGSQSKEMEIQK